MSDIIKMGTIDLIADENGFILVACPICDNEFKIPIDSMESNCATTCPKCKKELNEVCPPKDNIARAATRLSEQMIDECVPKLNETIENMNTDG